MLYRINEIKVPVLILIISCVFVCVVCLCLRLSACVCRHLRACLCVPVCMTLCGVYVCFMHLPSRGEFIMNDKLFNCLRNVYENDILSLCNECSVCQRGGPCAMI